MFKNLTIKSRLIFVIAILSVLLIAIGVMGMLGMSKASEGLRTVYEDRTVPMGQVSDIQKLLLTNRLRIAVSMVTPTPEVIQKNTAEVEQNIAEIGKLWDAYMATTLTPEEKILADKFAADRKQFVTEGLKPAIAALRANDLKLADRIVVEKIRVLYEPVGTGIQKLLQLQLDVAKHEYEDSISRYENNRNLSIGLIVGGLVMALWLGIALVRAIMRPLAEAQDVGKNCRWRPGQHYRDQEQ